MHHLYIFLSSPGDVSRERQLAREVIERLESERAHRDRLKLEVVAWDKPGAGTAMPAQMEPQEAINRRLRKPSECDIVIVIFWARMGTPLSEKYQKPNGSRYRSGTEYEFLDGIYAARQTDRPDVLVYRRKKPLCVDLDDPGREEKKKQWDLVEKFFAEFRNPDFRSYYKEYDEPSDFKEMLEQDLRDIITIILNAQLIDKTEVAPTPVIQKPFWPDSPFPGLRAFRPEESLIFHGRSREIDSLISKLSSSECRFIAVVGASGSGKSSLVAAGLLPALKKNAIHGSTDWFWAKFTPGEVGGNPFMALTSAFKPTLERNNIIPRVMAAELENEAEGLKKDKNKNPVSVKKLMAMALKGKPDWAELLLFIDQFEELFTPVDNKKYIEPFVTFLALVAQTPRVRTVVTMRADFYHRCLEWPVLDALIAKGQYPLLAPGPIALYDMITRPAEVAGLRFEEGLVQLILKDTGTEPGALPLMAFALSELWRATKGSDGLLTHGAYNSFNGVPGAIGKRAEGTFNETLVALKIKEDDLQASLGSVFRELIDVDDRDVATRRRALLSQITDGAIEEALVNALTEARLLVASSDEEKQPMREVAHEAIFTKWDRLSEWIKNHVVEIRICRRLTREAIDWQKAGAPRFKHLPDRATTKQYQKVRPSCSFGKDTKVVGRFLRAARMRQRIFEGILVLVVIALSILGTDIWLRSREINWKVLRIWALAQVGLYEGPPMVEISAGTFEMGNSDCTSDDTKIECPQHSVTIGAFWIGRYEVTFDEYSAFWLDSEYVKLPGHSDFGRSSRPVINVSWEEAQAYIEWLNKKVARNKTLRLPTEAEWEYACRANTKTLYHRGNTKEDLERVAWNKENSGEQTHPVGEKEPNAFGLYDMHGNVWEWCQDWYDENYYKISPKDNPQGPPKATARVVRGGGWVDGVQLCRSAVRGYSWPGRRSSHVGFRLSMSVALSP